MKYQLLIAVVLGCVGVFLVYGFESVPIQVVGTALLGFGVYLCRDKEARNEAR